MKRISVVGNPFKTRPTVLAVLPRTVKIEEDVEEESRHEDRSSSESIEEPALASDSVPRASSTPQSNDPAMKTNSSELSDTLVNPEKEGSTVNYDNTREELSAQPQTDKVEEGKEKIS